MHQSNKGNILVCGGAGYIGAHMCKMLAQRGFQPIVFDNFSTGHRWAVQWGRCVEGDLLNLADLQEAFERHEISAVMHFSARSLVGESVKNPALYFRNNVVGTLNLLDAMRSHGVSKLVFSSTAAVYGSPVYIPIDEAHPTHPINPYGLSKLMAEQAIEQYCSAYQMSAVALRYFNAAGSDPDGEVGELHDPETHLIPNIIKAAIRPEANQFKIFGDDYDTPDGTCVRDYVHVNDLCDAHMAALAHMDKEQGWHVFNLGTGAGHSVKEVLSSCQRVHSGLPKAKVHPRRPGDPKSLVATSEKASRVLGWEPQRTLDDCIETASLWLTQSESLKE